MRAIKLNIEGLMMEAQLRDWNELHGITLCCAILNEASNLEGFLNHHKASVDSIVIIDGGSSDNSAYIASQHADTVKLIKFKGHYGNQKNRAIEEAYTDWVLFLDPDERLSSAALSQLRSMIEQEEFDCYSFPRNNFIDGVADNSNGKDYQDRLFRSYCRYVRATHEEVVGFKSKHLCEETGVFIDHHKPSQRHSIRNNSYTVFDAVHMNELGLPGNQTKETFSRKYSSAIETARRMSKAI